MQCRQKPPPFHMISKEESLGQAAKFNIAEFIVIVSQLCLDRRSGTPSAPNFSSLPIPTLRVLTARLRCA